MAVITHITSVHERYDARIFLKECRSLAQRGHTVTLLVADGREVETRDGVRIESVRKIRSRLARMGLSTFLLLFRARALNAEIYHLHDPELIPLGLLLKLGGAKVVFDAHEDLPKQILSKPYIPGLLRRPLAALTAVFLRCTLVWMDGLVAVTSAVKESLRPARSRCEIINNYPIQGELDAGTRHPNPERAVCYLGGITRIRGLIELVQAMALLPEDVRLKLAGAMDEPGIEKVLKELPGWRHVDYLGLVSRSAMGEVMANCVGGVVTYLPEPNHLEAQPNKLFEYMSAGLPVIGSDFPLWRAILNEGPCGLCVDPQDPRAIADAIVVLLSQPDMVSTMGWNGQRAVRERFNWEMEAINLGAFYDSLLTSGDKVPKAV